MRADLVKFTTKVGTFYFYPVLTSSAVKDGKITTIVRDVPLSHMKVVRDAVVTKILDPRIDGEGQIRSTHALYAWAKKRIEGPASTARFLFVPAPGVWIKQGKTQTMGRQHRYVPRAA